MLAAGRCCMVQRAGSSSCGLSWTGRRVTGAGEEVALGHTEKINTAASTQSKCAVGRDDEQIRFGMHSSGQALVT